jgi:16S rRNA (cytosine967-C5)-methyltransferase
MSNKIVFELSSKAIDAAINEKIEFSKALKTILELDNIDPSFKSDIYAYVGCVLRHYYVFKRFIKDNLPDLESANHSLAYVVLANNLFLKKMSDDIAIDQLLSADSNYKKEELEDILKLALDEKTFISPNVIRGSIEHFSLRFNNPNWLTKMWCKQFGKTTTYKILRANSHPAPISVRVNTLLTSTNKLIDKYPHELTRSVLDNMLLYKKRSSIKKEIFYKNSSVIIEKLALNKVIDNAEVDPIKQTAIYADEFSPAFIEIALRLERKSKLELIIPPKKDIFKYKNKIGALNLKDFISIYECSIDGLMTAISSPLPLFIVIPRSSNLEELRNSPDYFLRFDPSSIDSIIKEQTKTLEESSKFIEANGKLVYIVPTINKKESSNIIEEFLSSHPEFSLLEEKQFFPFDEYQSSLYYAVLTRGE